MTSRQRMLAAIHHDPVDRVPIAPWGLGRISRDSVLGRELVARTDPWLEIGAGCNVWGGAAFPLEERCDGPHLIQTVHAPGRDLTAVWTTTARTTACTEPLCKNIADVEALLAIPYVGPHPDLDAWRAWRAWAGDDGLAVMGLANGLCYPNDMLGTETCSLLWAAEPEIIRRMAATAAERTFRVVEEACRGGVDCFRIVGGEYATQLMGRRAWDELVVPYDRPLIDMIHSYGAIAHYHNHGSMGRFLEDIAALGIDSLDPVEQPPYGDMDMAEAMARIGDRVCLVGGLDDMEILETRPLGEVLRLGADLLERVGRRGYMLGGTSSGIYSEAAARAFIALVDVAEGKRIERG
jgi:uroporphyrinogen-III decarboxylase